MDAVKVLIADDDPLVRMDLRLALIKQGHRVIAEAEDGRKALALARSLHPDLVIIDVIMPHLDGLDVARHLRDEGLAPVILLTGYSEDSMIARADAVGVMAYLRKPFREEDLTPAVTIALGRYRERRRLESEVIDLKDKMEARKIVGRAKALLMEKHNLSEREAFHRIHSQSQQLQKPPHEIAQAILTASELGV